MKKKIAILGSTGSIGKSLLKVISKDQNKYEILLLTAKKNYKLLFKQAKKFKVKNIIISDHKFFKIAISKKNRSIKIYNNFNDLKNILPKKIDYVMSSIVGLDGLDPTLKIIKHTKTIAIANKEAIICGWNLIKNQILKHNTKFIPVDSEHHSIWHALNQNIKSNLVQKVYITASGGSLLNVPKNKINKINIGQVLKHPNWKMGKKITVDSSNLMNKVFEIIEAKKIFNFNYSQLEILIHPDSYIHAIVLFKSKMISIIAHNTSMEIPIYNTLGNMENKIKKNNSYHLDLNKLNNLILKNVDLKKFSLVRLLEMMPNKDSLFETALISANDYLVNLYLNKKIQYVDISKNLLKLVNSKEIKSLKTKYPKNVKCIMKTNNDVCLKVNKIL